MKHLNFILAGLFFLCGLCCRAQVLPLEENVVLNTKEGQIKGKLLLPGGVKTCPVVLIIRLTKICIYPILLRILQPQKNSIKL
jgi:uncharacterized protein